jgi:hypothetical protein
MRARSAHAAALILLAFLVRTALDLTQSLGSAHVHSQLAPRPDVLRGPGLDAVPYRIRPSLQCAVLSDGSVSWPVTLGGKPRGSGRQARLFPSASPVRIRPGRERFLVAPGTDGPN